MGASGRGGALPSRRDAESEAQEFWPFETGAAESRLRARRGAAPGPGVAEVRRGVCPGLAHRKVCRCADRLCARTRGDRADGDAVGGGQVLARKRAGRAFDSQVGAGRVKGCRVAEEGRNSPAVGGSFGLAISLGNPSPPATTPCRAPALSEEPRRVAGYFPALRRSFGVASQVISALGGARRRSSSMATPAFLRAVMWCLEPTAVAIKSSRCGAWPKSKTTELSLSLDSSRNSWRGSAPGKRSSVL